MPKQDDYPDLPGISRSEALKRLRKAGIKFRTLDRPIPYESGNINVPPSGIRSFQDMSLGYREADPMAVSGLPMSEAERFGPIARDKRSVARAQLLEYENKTSNLGTRLLERYPKAAARRAVGPGRLTERVGRGAKVLFKNLTKKKKGMLGLGLTAASIGSSIQEAQKK